MPYWSKGKQKALPRADDDGGTTSGVVIPLQLVGSGTLDAAYTVPVSIGDNNQQFSLQVDTGSSDLWIASTSCSSSACSQTGGHNYDPSVSGTQTGKDFSIQYLSGQVSGPIVWDSFVVGGYSIQHQAMAAATSVSSETLAPDFSGILGLALPLNSVIAQQIQPVTNNAPDGAAWASNLFSITPASAAPASRFLSLSLSRPGSDRIPALFGIGKHPPELVDDPSQIYYASVVSTPTGSLFWKASVRDITVYVNGQPRKVNIGRSNTGAVFPSAVIDSGVPFILTTSTLANAIYGAIDVHPAKDGNYYVPCQTPLNLTITIDDRPPFALHPLDLTAEPPQDNQAEYCIGLIQAADSALAHPGSGIGDIILGVPFMRNVYTVMAYAVPDTNGTFPPVNTSTSNTLQPRLGLMSLTNPATAMSEFNTVRVLNQPLTNNSQSNFSHPDAGKLSVGIIVLISLLGFFALCCTMFLIRWFIYRKKYERERVKERQQVLTDDKRALVYQLARRGSVDFTGMPNEDTLRAMRYEAYMKKERAMSFSSRSQPTPLDDMDEFGVRPVEKEEWNDDTLVSRVQPLSSTRSSSSSSSLERRFTTSGTPTGPHQRTSSIATPLLHSVHSFHLSDHYDDHHVPYRDDDTRQVS